MHLWTSMPVFIAIGMVCYKMCAIKSDYAPASVQAKLFAYSLPN